MSSCTCCLNPGPTSAAPALVSEATGPRGQEGHTGEVGVQGPELTWTLQLPATGMLGSWQGACLGGGGIIILVPAAPQLLWGSWPPSPQPNAQPAMPLPLPSPGPGPIANGPSLGPGSAWPCQCCPCRWRGAEPAAAAAAGTVGHRRLLDLPGTGEDVPGQQEGREWPGGPAGRAWVSILLPGGCGRRRPTSLGGPGDW